MQLCHYHHVGTGVGGGGTKAPPVCLTVADKGRERKQQLPKTRSALEATPIRTAPPTRWRKKKRFSKNFEEVPTCESKEGTVTAVCQISTGVEINKKTKSLTRLKNGVNGRESWIFDDIEIWKEK